MKRINAGYFIKEALKNVFVNGFMGLASIFILMSCLIIIGLFIAMTKNVELNIKNLEDQNEIVVFVSEKLTLDEAKKLKTTIDAVPNVKQSIFVSNAEALKTFEEEFKDAKDLLSELQKDNPIRHSYRIFLSDLSKSEQTIKTISALPNIAKIRQNEYVTNNIINLRNVFGIVALSFFLILFAISLFIIYNTIRLAMVARKKEINIMKFVGATNSFIRWPFIIEGLIIGAVAATIAYFLQWYLYSYFVNQVFKGINLIKLINFSEISGLLLALFYLTGMLVGVIGSMLAIRKYLDV